MSWPDAFAVVGLAFCFVGVPMIFLMLEKWIEHKERAWRYKEERDCEH